MTLFAAVDSLISYGIKKELIEKEDVIFFRNRLLEEFREYSYEKNSGELSDDLPFILSSLCDIAVERGIIENGSTSRDLFDTKLMGIITPPPSFINKKFYGYYKDSPEKATDFYYAFSQDTNYVRRDRVARDVKWVGKTEYGELDITVNLSKPEKDPKAIAAAKLMKQSSYPKCQLCAENEGYSGRMDHPARQNHRVIRLELDDHRWFLQYSPYVYYNEHCIVFNSEHTPMKIDRSTFVKLLEFVTKFPHYFLGSNADLPIVGGSILTHDHFQGGRYTFAMERAPIEKEVCFKGFGSVKAGIVKWPMSVIRLTSESRDDLVSLSDKILSAWRGYTDESAFIFAETNGEKHNTITPIARRRDNGSKEKLYELDLVLRNNITTDEHPLGVFHPHSELHHIKKENIGLIEVMGLAVLPSRLKKELAEVERKLVSGESFDGPLTAHHAEWAEGIKARHPELCESNVSDIVKKEVTSVFAEVLEHAGVYKRTPEGQKAFLRFIESV